MNSSSSEESTSIRHTRGSHAMHKAPNQQDSQWVSFAQKGDQNSCKRHHRLTGLSKIRSDATTTFQTTSKRAKKVGALNYYKKYDTKRGWKGANIYLINEPNVKFACYLVAGEMMRHYTKGEFTLDTISVAENCVQGA